MADEDKKRPSAPPTHAHAWLEELFGASPMAIGVSRDGLMLDANPAYAKLFGYDSVGEITGQSILRQIAPSDRPRIAEMVAQRARGEHVPERYETRGLRKDGSEFPFEVTTTRTVVDESPVTIAFVSDLSAREQALASLRDSEDRLRTLAGAAFEGVFIHADGVVVLANEAGAEMYHQPPESLIGLPVMDLIAPESRRRIIERIQRGATDTHDAVALRRDGSTFVVEVHPRTFVYQGRSARVVILRDVTEKRRVDAEQRALAERTLHAQKLESLGMLAGGVAHDFNNILTVISNGVALAKRDPTLTSSTTAHLDTICVATARAADLCRQLLAYAGKAGFSRESIDLSALVAEMSSMLEVSIAKKARLVRELAPGVPPLSGDATQIRQVVMNLVLNASEAIGDAEGTVVVSTGFGVLDADALSRSLAGGEPKPGMYACIEVRDDGVGMDPPTVSQMFDPFFTTKFTGRGLGMSAVLGIVRSHAGAIDVESAPGKGTCVRVLFPASEAEHPKKAASDSLPAQSAGVVLVVDDEANIRVSTRLLLESFGFEVLVAADGLEAIDVARANSGRIGAVLLDLTMPRMNGLEAMKELRRIAPTLPIVLNTGYGVTIANARGGESEPSATADAVLAKPYSAAELVATLGLVMRPHK